jgi:hypothetical protein
MTGAAINGLPEIAQLPEGGCTKDCQGLQTQLWRKT